MNHPSKRKRRDPARGGGLGHPRRKTILPVLAIVLMMAVCFLPLSDNSDAIIATGGSGIADDPYWGNLDIDLEPSPMGGMEEIYVEYGTTIVFRTSADYTIGTSGAVENLESSVVNGIWSLSGTALGSFTIMINIDPMFETYSVNVHVTESIQTLEFLSNPISDGILIPPNHHLVRFLDTDGTCIGCDVVKHGETAIAPEGYGLSFWTIDDESGTSIYDMDSAIESDIELTLFSGKSIFVSNETIEIATGRGGFEVDTIGGVTWTATVSDPTIVSISISDGYVDIQGDQKRFLCNHDPSIHRG